MHAGFHPIDAKQHHAGQRRLEEKAIRQHQRTDNAARFAGKHRPVGAELKLHDHAGDGANRHGEREYLDPEVQRLMRFRPPAP